MAFNEGNASVVWRVCSTEDGSGALIFTSPLFGLVRVGKEHLCLEHHPELGDNERVMLELRPEGAVLACGTPEGLRHFFLQRGVAFPGFSGDPAPERL